MRSSTLLLKLIGEAGEDGIGLDALESIAGISRKAIVMATGVLAQRGLLDRPAPGCYRLTAAGRLALEAGVEIKPGSSGPRAAKRCAKCLRARLWRAMRALNKFGVDDLLLRAANGDEADAHDNARKYLGALERAGYLIRLKHRLPGEAKKSNGFVRWILINNTGPKAPVWRLRQGRVFDPNTGDSIDLSAPETAQETAHV